MVSAAVFLSVVCIISKGLSHLVFYFIVITVLYDRPLPLFYNMEGKEEDGKVYELFAKSLDLLGKERDPVGSFSLMETQLGNVGWYREQEVGEGKRE